MLILSVGLILARPTAAPSQMAVLDVANLAQSISQVMQLIEMIGLKLKDIAPLPQFAQVLEIMGQLQVVNQDIITLMNQIEARSRGWDTLMITVPCSSVDLRAWNAQAFEWGRQGAQEARQMTQLARTGLELVTHLITLTGSVFGTTSGLQTVALLSNVLIIEMKKQQTSSLGFQQVLLGQQQMEHMNHLATICLQQKRLKDWGTITRW